MGRGVRPWPTAPVGRPERPARYPRGLFGTRAAIGPHRSDFTMHHLGNGMPADQCSTGEQKALLIAIVLANARLETAERNRAPLLLLDEVAAGAAESEENAP